LTARPDSLRRRRARVGEAKSPVYISWKIGEQDHTNHARTEHPVAAGVPPCAFSRIEPLRPIQAVQPGAADLAARTALLEIRQENVLVGGARAVRPALIRADILGLVGRNEVGKANQFLVALAD